MKVLVPYGPTADEVLPYLRRIDAAHWYSNSGPLVRSLEARMGGVSVASATLGIELASRCVFKKKRVRIPAFTFVATATALIRAGFDPVLCDVSLENWGLVDPDEQSLSVCPFGASVAPGGLVDAAAGYGNQLSGNRVYSLHATKSLSAGEGGMVCGDEDLIERVRKLANFGLERSDLHNHGVVTEAGTNAKMSEYHAAVGLASLDAWPKNRAKREQLAKWYRERLIYRVEFQPNPGVQTVFPIRIKNAEEVAKRLASRGIETRRWYTPTLDRHPAFRHLERGALDNCHTLADEILCLPFHLGMDERDVDIVCDALGSVPKRHDIDLCGEGRPYA